MKLIGRRGSLGVVAVAAVLCGGVALAQVNPLGGGNNAAPDNPLAPAPKPANPLDPPAAGDNPLGAGKAAPAKIDAPDFIKPGARLIYLHTSSLADRGPHRPNTADGAIVQHDVVAVLPDRVLTTVTGFARDPNSGDAVAMSTTGGVLTADKVGVAGGSAWAPKATLANLQSVPGMDVSVGDWPMNNRNYRAVILRFDERGETTIRAFDQGTGLMLSEAFGGGRVLPGQPANGGLNREVQRNTQFQSYRAVEWPWAKANAKAPPWAATVKRMTYRGLQRLILNGNVGPGGVQVDGEVTFDERGDTWAIGTITSRVPDHPPTQSKHVQGHNSLGAYWMSPEVLRDLKPGVIDTDPTLGVVVEYAVEDRGPVKLGVITQRSAKGVNVRSFAYSLEDGALVGTRFLRKQIGSLLEFELVGRE